MQALINLIKGIVIAGGIGASLGYIASLYAHVGAQAIIPLLSLPH